MDPMKISDRKPALSPASRMSAMGGRTAIAPDDCFDEAYVMRALISTAVATFLTGCSLQPPQDASAFHTVSEDWLIGNWVADGESCEGDGVFSLETDGRWEAELERGTWSLEGDEMTFARTGVMDEQLSGYKPLTPPVLWTEGVAKISADAYRAVRSDGSKTVVVRCSR